MLLVIAYIVLNCSFYKEGIYMGYIIIYVNKPKQKNH